MSAGSASPQVQITEVVVFPLVATPVRMFVLDQPLPLAHSDIYAIEVEGWILSACSLSGIEIMHQGTILRRAPIRICRPDVAADHPDLNVPNQCGFWMPVGTLGLPQDFELRVDVVYGSSTRQTVALIRGTNSPLVSSYRSQFQPLMIYTPGRTGSTWLIHLLREHPQLVARKVYPYETRAGEYWMQVLKVLSDPCDPFHAFEPYDCSGRVAAPPHYFEAPARSWTPGSGLEVNHWLGTKQVWHLATVCQRTIDEYYRQVAVHQGKHSASYFIEKYFTIGYLSRLMSSLYPQCRRVFLIRDFRDVFCSMTAFDKKRGFPGFGRRPCDSDEEFLQTLFANVTAFANEFRTGYDSSLLVRYEELVGSPVVTLRTIFEYLDVDANLELIAELYDRSCQEAAFLRGHETVLIAADTIGRWKSNLPPHLAARCQELFGGLLREFGYHD